MKNLKSHNVISCGSNGSSIAMVAGETSGDLLASRLLSGLRVHMPDTLIHGIGGVRMAEYGFVSHTPIEKLAVRGVFEVLAHYREIKRIQTTLSDQLLLERPAVFIGVDAPDFNLTLEERLKQSGIPTVHYVSPSIWAWRAKRIKKIARSVSHMLVIFPFEQAIYEQAGIPVTYVGHPLAEVIPMQPNKISARKKLGFREEGIVVTIMPGSRMSELKYNVAAFVGAAKILAKRNQNIQFLVPMVSVQHRVYFQDLLVRSGLQDVALTILDGNSYLAMEAADAVLVASGTATLEVALFKKPMVIGYKMMRASWEIMRHLSYQPWVGLPNILAQSFLVPEFLQHQATPEALANAVSEQLDNVFQQQKLLDHFTQMHHTLLRHSAQESADAVLKVMGR